MRKNLWIRKAVAYFSVACMLAMAVFTPMKVQAASEDESESLDIEGMLSGVEEKISDALSRMDSETVQEVFDFLKEKVSDGSLHSKEGIASAIEEGEARFGITIDEQAATQIVDTMEKLEELGFSGEEIVERAQELYDTYGADFVAHANEAFTKAVEDAVTSAIKGFFKNLWEGVKSSVGNFFESLF